MRWLHISDVHYNPDGDGWTTAEQRDALLDYLAALDKPVDEIFVTGDFRYALEQEDNDDEARELVAWLGRLSEKILIHDDPKHIHLVPGNHDLVQDDATRVEAIRQRYTSDKGKFSAEDKDFLLGRFTYYNRICSFLYGNAPTPWVHKYVYLEPHNIYLLYMNTAITCADSKTDYQHIVIGCDDLARALKEIQEENKTNAPIIALAHHGTENFEAEERKNVKKLLQKYKVALYLCGHAHQGNADILGRNPVEIIMGCIKDTKNTQAIFTIGEYENGQIKKINAHRWELGSWGAYPQFDNMLKQYLPTADGIKTGEPTVFGRDALANDVADALKNHAMVVVHGAPGIGKSTLCRKVLGGNILEMDLTQKNNLASALTAMVSAFGITPDSDLPKQVLRLCQRHTDKTLYLDNLEDPLQDDEFKQWLFQFACQLNRPILCSSRYVLIDHMVKNIPVPELSPDAAREMFLLHWDEEIPPADGEKLDKLLDQLDCHPLSIRLIAAQKYRLTNITELQEEWNDTRLNDTAGENEADLHRSLPTALRMSYNTIQKNPAAKILWGIHAYLSDTMSKEQFNALFAHNLPAYKTAANLLLKNSLITRTHNGDSFTDKMLAPIKQQVFHFDASLKEECKAILYEVLTRVYHETSEWKHPSYIQRNDLALSFLSTALTFVTNKEPTEQVESLLYVMVNYYQYAASMSLKMLYSIKIDEKENYSNTYLFIRIGALESRLSRYNLSMQYLNKSITISRNKKYHHFLSRGLKLLSEIMQHQGNVNESIEYLNEAEQICRDNNDELELANVLLELGELNLIHKDKNDAKNYYQEAEKIYRAKQDKLGLANALRELGEIERLSKKYDLAEVKYTEAEKFFIEERSELGEANVIRDRGHLSYDQNDRLSAILHYSKALKLYESVQIPMGRAYCIAYLCRAHARQGNTDEALHYLSIAEGLDPIAKTTDEEINEILTEAKQLLNPQ